MSTEVRGGEMALRLSITPTFYLSRKFRVLHARSLHWIRLSSPSLGHVFLCYPLSKPSLKANSYSSVRLTSIRHRILASSYSEQSRETEEDSLESIVPKPSERKSAINYSLSSGFLTNQRDSDGYSKRSLSRSGESRQQGVQEPQRVVERDSKLGDGSSKGFGDGYSQKLVSHIGESREQDGRLRAKRHSSEPYSSSSGLSQSRDGYGQTRFGEGPQGSGQEARGTEYNERERRWTFSNDRYVNDSDPRSRKRGEQECEDELNSSREAEGGDWLGSRTEGRNFRNSKLFKDPRVSLNNRIKPRYSRGENRQTPRQEFDAEELEAWKQAKLGEGLGSGMEGRDIRNSNLVKEARVSLNTDINSRSSRDAIWSSLDEEVDQELDIWMDSKGSDWSGSEASNIRNPNARNKSVEIRSSSEQDLEDDMDAWQEAEDSDRLGAPVNERDFRNSKSYKSSRTSLINEMTPRYAPRSIGARTVPSKPSIPGKFSKYSKSAHQGTTSTSPKVAPTSRTYSSPSFSSLQSKDISSPSTSDDPKVNDELAVNSAETPTSPDWIPAVIKPDFDYQFSYTETPKVAPIGFREPVYSPFGPGTMARPWTGKAPLGKSKKKLPEFDSFKPPPPGKKGVKRVQQPGPYPEGQGPKDAYSREEILGEPLTKAEVKELVDRCVKESRQLNLGRDGLTHNMLDLVHQHWKRRRVCRIKCKGVPTVDMDNVCEKLEEKTGGRIIHRAGGVLYVYRGRNYNYKNRPKIPLMLWKPPAPIYPKLIQPAPEGLTKDEASKLRILGRKLPSICRLGKNGVYLTLVAHVRNAFEVDDLVKVDCKGLNPSDYKKIGAKLKDLVPCVLLSFERECILMWKGRQSQPESFENDGSHKAPTSKSEIVLSETGQEFLHETLLSEDYQAFNLSTEEVSGDEEQQRELGEDEEGEIEEGEEGELVEDEEGEIEEGEEGELDEDEEGDSDSAYNSGTEAGSIVGAHMDKSDKEVSGSSDLGHAVVVLEKAVGDDITEMRDNASTQDLEMDVNRDPSEAEVARNDIEQLWEQAIEAGEATVLDDPELDPDTLFQKVKLCCGSSYTSTVQNSDNLQRIQSKNTRSDRLEKGRSSKVDDSLLERTANDPRGLLRVDELAKLLAP